MMTANDTSRNVSDCGVRFEGDWFPLSGNTVSQAKALLRDAGNIPYFADALVNGRPVGVGHVLRHGDRLGFSQRFGFKGGGDRPAEAQAGALVIAYPELTDIAARVKALGLPADRSLDVMAGMVATWAEGRFGPVPNKLEAVLGEIVDRLDRIESPRVPRTQRELDIVQALGERLPDWRSSRCQVGLRIRRVLQASPLVDEEPGDHRQQAERLLRPQRLKDRTATGPTHRSLKSTIPM